VLGRRRDIYTADRSKLSKREVCIISGVVVVSLCCANPFQRHYVANPAFPKEVSRPLSSPADASFASVLPEEYQNRYDELSSHGMQCIGEANWVGSRTGTPKEARQQAAKVGAHHVIHSQQYLNTTSSSVPITTPTQQTTYHSGGVYTSGGYASYGGYSTTYGTQTTYVPVIRHIFRIRSSFWIDRERTAEESEKQNP